MNETSKALIVLGCADEEVSRERALAAIIYARKHDISRIILSGGLGKEGISEAQMMHNRIKRFSNNIQVILEENSTNTTENFTMVDAIENGNLSTHPEDYILLTSCSHNFRLRSEYPNVKKISAEPILSKRGSASRTMKKRHKKYWGYELARPIMKKLPQKYWTWAKNLLNKI